MNSQPLEIVDELAKLPAAALVTKAGLAKMLRVTRRKIELMASTGELPPPIKFAGRSTWLAGRVIQHIELQADRAGRQAVQLTPTRRAVG